MAIRLSLQEQETCITYNRQDANAVVMTCDQALVNDLTKRGAKGENRGAATVFVVPKTWVKVRKPKRVELTDEQKADRAERMRNMRGGKPKGRKQPQLTI